MSLNKAQPVVDGDGVIQTGLNATPKSVDEIVAEAQANIAQAIDASAHESLPASVSAQVAKVVTDSATDMLLAERDQRLMAFIQAVDRGQTTPTLERAEGETRDQWMPRVCKALGVPLPATTIVEGDVIATLIKFRDQIEFPQADESLMDEKQLAAHQAGEIIDEAEYDASMHAAKSATGELDIASLEIAADPDAVTPWFSGDVDPVHFGEYECMNPVDGSYFRATYDPMFEEWTSGGAACIWQFPTWRGLLAPAS